MPMEIGTFPENSLHISLVEGLLFASKYLLLAKSHLIYSWLVCNSHFHFYHSKHIHFFEFSLLHLKYRSEIL